MTAREYLSRYGSKIVEVELHNGTNWTGQIAFASGTLSTVFPAPAYLDFNRILDIEEYREKGFQYDFKHETIAPGDIKKISVIG